MITVERTITSKGFEDVVYDAEMPENVAEFIEMLKSTDETAEVTVNVSGLLKLAEYALKAYNIERDNKVRLTMTKGEKTPKVGRLVKLGL